LPDLAIFRKISLHTKPNPLSRIRIAPLLNHFSSFFKKPHLFTPSAILLPPDKAQDAAERMHKGAATGNQPHEALPTQNRPFFLFYEPKSWRNFLCARVLFIIFLV
jgi:hypothetical protein